MSSERHALERRRIPSQDRAKERVERILAATRAIMLEAGISAVTTARVAERAGVPVGSVYQYFPNKKAIFLALYAHYLDHVRGVVEQFEREGPYAEGWEVFLGQMAAAIKRAEFEEDIEGILMSTSQAFPELREYEDRHHERVIEAYVRILRRLGSRWPKAKLRRLVQYAYAINLGRMHYRRQCRPPPREIESWDRAVVLAIYGQCMAD